MKKNQNPSPPLPSSSAEASSCAMPKQKPAMARSRRLLEVGDGLEHLVVLVAQLLVEFLELADCFLGLS